MRFVILPIIACLLAGCATKPQPRVAASGPIDWLVTDLQTYKWGSEAYPMLDLPESASPDEVVAKTFQMTGFDKGHVTSYKIMEIRQVHIPGSLPDLYTAVLVHTDFGQKIVLFQYRGGWMSRVYDTKPSA
jgi:uncharacterized protein YceK